MRQGSQSSEPADCSVGCAWFPTCIALHVTSTDQLGRLGLRCANVTVGAIPNVTNTLQDCVMSWLCAWFCFLRKLDRPLKEEIYRRAALIVN